MRRTITRSLFIVTAGAWFMAFAADTASAQSWIFTVNTTSDTIVPNACSNIAPGCSLRGAITAANPNSDALIRFNIPASDPFCSAGICTINITSSLPTIIGPNITIAGPGADRLVVRPATGVSTHIFGVFSNSFTRISGLTVRYGFAQGGFAGGITKGGNTGTGVLEIVDVLLTENTGNSNQPSGIQVENGTVSVIRSTIRANVATLADSGAIRVLPAGVCNIIGSTIALNDVVGIVSDGPLNVTNSTIAFNIGGLRAGGVYKVAGSAGLASIKNSIIAGNLSSTAADDVEGNFTSAGFNLIGKVDGSTGFTAPTDLKGTTAAPLDPRFYAFSSQGGSTPVISLRPNSPAIDKGTSSGLTGVLAFDQRSTGFPRRRDNPLVVNAVGGDGTDIGALERHTHSEFDFDADGRTEVGIFRPSGGEWWVNRSLSGTTLAFQFGASTDRITPADFTGDGATDITFWRPGSGEWFVLRSENNTFYAFGFGTNGDLPAPGDFDGDRLADAAVFRPSGGTWFIMRSTGGTQIQQFGANGDVPVVADYDGDGRADIAIYRPSNGQWWLNRSTTGVTALTFGGAGDKPVPGDFTGDNKTDVAFWRPSTGEWYVLRSEDLTFFAFSFGVNGDIPAPGDYDGDGKCDATVFRPSSATWFSLRSLGGSAIQQFGANGDRPLANAFVP